MAEIKSRERKFSHFKIYFREYSDYTGIHGLKFIGERRSLCEKIIWTIVFFMSLTICILIVYEVFKKWHKSPVVVNFATEQVNIFDITFPAVTICPETKVYSDYFNFSYSLMNVNETTPEQLKKLQYMSLLCDSNVLLDRIPKNNFTDEDFYTFLKTGAPNFLRKCSWMGRDIPCEQIFQPLYTDEGLCVTFNMLSKREMFTDKAENIDPPPQSYIDRSSAGWSADHGYHAGVSSDTYPRRALLSGSTNALEVSFALNNTDVDYGCTHFQGYKVVLHNPIRFPTISTHYFRIPLKKSVMVAITPSMILTSEDLRDYNTEKRNCYFQSDTKLTYFSNYSQINCQMECDIKMTIDRCQCVEYYMPRNKSMPICGIGKMECLQQVSHIRSYIYLPQVYIHNHMYRKKHHADQGLCHCPPMCNNMDYNVEITESDYDWPRKMKAIGIDVVQEDEEGLATSELQIYFKQNMFIPQQRSEMYGTFEFLANVGGLLGLFVGFSLISMIELVYFLSLRIICNLNLYNNWYGKPKSPIMNLA
ncbi:pickpocket protein 28-like [Cylas formicarius]|uniref:pickpocket protein 28-like n=1 Tax=Cylas formicarius TaxID=197179 RepID=UPI002958CD46|nr:pickpocket protein 28-like [Cylas formicarius]